MRGEVQFGPDGQPAFYFACRPFGPLNSGHLQNLTEPRLIRNFRDFLVDFWISYKQPRVSISVMDVQDSTILLSIKSPSGFRLQPGLTLNIGRSYRMGTQREEYLEYLQDKMRYLENDVTDSVQYNKAAAEHEFLLTKEYAENLPEGHDFITGDFIGTARLVEVYDSTGRAQLISSVPWSKPKAEDSMNFD